MNRETHEVGLGEKRGKIGGRLKDFQRVPVNREGGNRNISLKKREVIGGRGFNVQKYLYNTKA